MVSGIKECIEAYAEKRGIPKHKATEEFNTALDVICEKCVEGGVSFKDRFSLKQKVKKGRAGCVNGREWSTEDSTTLVLKLGKELKEELNK